MLLGLASSGLLALASTREWFRDGIQAPVIEGPGATEPGQAPLATALALVVLACWGVLLVTRGVVRRAVGLLATVAALGVAATIVDAWLRLPDLAGEPSALAPVGPQADPGWSGWFWTAATCAVLTVVAGALAVRWMRDWPEMGSRYDAPGGARSTEPVAGEESGDLWRSIDEGHDPTA